MQAQIKNNINSQLQVLWATVLEDHSQINNILQSRWYDKTTDKQSLYIYNISKILDPDYSPKWYTEYTSPNGNIMTIDTSISQTMGKWTICIIKEYNNVIIKIKHWEDYLKIHFIEDIESGDIYKSVSSTTTEYIEIPNIDECKKVYIIKP